MPVTKRTITKTGVGSASGGGGGGGGSGQFGYHVITPAAGNATIDIAALGAGTTCFCFRLVLTGTAVTILAPIWTGGSIVAGLKVWLFLDQDGSGSRVTPTFAGGAGAFTTDTIGWEVNPTPSTRTTYQFTYHGTIWGLDAVRNLCAIS